MPKFVIIDHSLCDFNGHYYEYDVSIAEASERIGYEPIIVSNIQFSKKYHPSNIKVIPVFSRNWAGVSITKFTFFKKIIKSLKHIISLRIKPKRTILVILKTIYLTLLISTPYLKPLWEELESNLLNFKRAIKSDIGKIVFPGYICSKILLKLKKIFKIVLPLETFILLTKVFISSLQEIYNLINNQNKKILGWVLGKNKPIFTKELKKLLKILVLTKEDHIFIPTIGIDQLEELLNFLADKSHSSTPHYHILLRRDCDEWLVTSAKGIGLKACLNRFYGSRLWDEIVTFYTDTDELTDQHNALSPIRFITAPIPFRHENLKNQINSVDVAEQPINIVYLGDARIEKGYQYLPLLVDALWFSHIQPGKVKFTIQSNFNLPGGEPGMQEARLRLEQYPSHKVRLLKEPLSTEDYYDLINNADIIVIPYLTDQYRARSSGILVEAIAAGKPVVVSDETWMANQIEESRGSIYASSSELPNAVLKILNNYQQFAKAAYEYRLLWRAKHSPDTLVKCLIIKQNLIPEVQKYLENSAPSIVYIIDADSLVQKVGAGQVARNQLDYLCRCGYRVYGVFFFKNPFLTDKEYNNYLAIAQNILEEIGTVDKNTKNNNSKRRPKLAIIESWFLRVSFKFSFNNITKLYRYIITNKNSSSLEIDLLIRHNVNITDSLKNFVKTQKIDAVFINYITNFPLVENLGLGKVPVICEMHDIQAHQYAIYNNTDINEKEFQLECQLLDRCSVVLANNMKELEKAQEIVQKSVLHYVPYIGRLSPPKNTDLVGCESLVDIFCLSGSERCQDTEQNRRLIKADSLDLLFVSSYHAPNIYSLKWFFNNVYLPYLADKEINFVIAGNIMNFGDLGEISHPNVFVAGQVENLQPLYAATRVVILPIVAGAGFNIKTIEALSMGKPVVATSMALRGINYDRQAFPVFDEPEDFASQIIQLLNNSKMRLSCATKGFELVRSQYQQGNFDEAMNAALANVFREKILLPQPLKPESWEANLVEWVSENNNFVRIIRSFTERDDLGEEGFCQALYQTIINKSNAIVNKKNNIIHELNESQSDGLVCKSSDSDKILKRICILVPQEIRFYYPTIKLLANVIVDAGYSVDIFCIDFGNPLEIANQYNFKVISYKPYWNYRTNFLEGNLEFLAKAIVEIGCYDVYIGLNEFGILAAHFLAEKLFNKPWIAYMLEMVEDNWKLRNYVKSLLAKADAFVDVDPNRLKLRISQIDLPKNNFYIRNVPAKAEINNINISNKFKKSNLILWYHGTISPSHGINEIIDGYCRSKSSTELHLTGPILEVEGREEIIKRIKNTNKPIILHKAVPRKMVLTRAVEFADIAICFYPYRNQAHEEYFNRVYANPAKVFDYMALGIPTITSDNPSLLEYVQEEGWGICVSPEDPYALAEAIDLLANDYHLRSQMSKRAKELFISKYNLEQESLFFINWLKNINQHREGK